MPPPPCPACAFPAPGSFARGLEGREYFCCPSCALVFLDPAARLAPEKERERYLLHDNGPESPGYAAYLSEFADTAIAPFVPLKSRILDYGSGPYPLLTRILSERGFDAHAWDPLFSPVPPDPRLTFDLVVAHEVLEHCHRPLDALRDIATKLSPGGVLSLSTLFRPAQAKAFLSWWYRQDSTHLSFFSEECLSDICGRAGFEKIWSDGRSRAAFRLAVS
jgi:SAM-dependent methyltransferase